MRTRLGDSLNGSLASASGIEETDVAVGRLRHLALFGTFVLIAINGSMQFVRIPGVVDRVSET